MPYFSFEDQQLYYRVAGSGKTALLLIHGWYQTGRQAFAPLVPHLCKKGRVFIPDLPGHGLSPQLPSAFSTAENERLLIAYIHHIREHYRCRKVFLLGHSYGAFSVLSIAAQIRGVLNGIIAISAVDDYGPYHKRLKRVLRIPRLLSPVYYRMQALLGGFPYGDREQLYGGIHHALKPGKLEYAKKKNKTLSPKNARHYMRAFLSAHVHWPPHKLKVPLLLIYGERDALTPASWAKRITPHFTRSRVEVIAESGHNVQLSAPAKVARLVEEFMRDG